MAMTVINFIAKKLSQESFFFTINAIKNKIIYGDDGRRV
jgi:hypothetical protein